MRDTIAILLGTPPRATHNSPAKQWRISAWIAGVFVVIVALGMLAGYLSTKENDPLNSVQLRALKEKLRADPVDEATKVEIRQLDLQLRQTYFRHLSRMASGVYLLLGGVAVFLFSVARTSALERQLPSPGPRPSNPSGPDLTARAGRWSVAAAAMVAGGFFIALGLWVPTAVPTRVADIDKLLGREADSPATAPQTPSAEMLAHNWPQFRGMAAGLSFFTNTPSKWDVGSGNGIAWKTQVPAAGFNSPIIWEDRVFISGGDAKVREVFAFDLKNGNLLWRQPIANVPGTPTQPLEIPDTTGYAAPTMATDGQHVYVIFANGDLTALTLDGRSAWSKGFGALKNPYGHASSLATWKDRLIVLLDQGDSEENLSKLYALDGRTGRVLWQTPRKVGGSWASPIVIEAAGKSQIITLAVPWVIAYSALDGTEIWRADCLNGEVTPSPAFAGGLLLIASPSEKLVAIRPDGQGDVTKTHIAWTAEDNVPDVTSPVSNGELVFTLTTAGMLSCFDLKDGKKQWEHDFEMECHASPAIAGDKLYLFSQNGTAVVVQTARQFKEIFRTEMADAFHASPAFAQDRIVLRGTRYLWCLGPARLNLVQQQPSAK